MSKNLIQLHQGSKGFGAKNLFHDVTFSINEEEHVGVIGANGAGKTTLFKILNQQETLDHGNVIKSNQLKLGYLEQEVSWGESQTLEHYLSDCIKPIWELKSLGLSLGLDDAMFHQPIQSLSGGYQMRSKLLCLLGHEPNLMLLDEPTNYLDLETVLVLEQFLQEFRGSFLLISHDREFLKKTTDHTLEIEHSEITKFNGHIEDYFAQKAMLREQLEKQSLGVEAKRKKIIDFANRFGAKATKARQAQSKLKSLKKLEKIEIKSLPISAKINIPSPENIGKCSISLKDLSLGYEEKNVLSNVNLEFKKGDRVAIVGYNGAGKSTLLKGLVHSLKPQSGTVHHGYGVHTGYYAQHVSKELDPNLTVYQELEQDSHLDVLPQQVLDLAGSLLFSGESVKKKISVLSGGEKARVALGKILLKKVSTLILDEPTNHLDFHTVESLTQSLSEFPGVLVVVSHDRSFIKRVANKIVEIRNGQAHVYYGSYEEYVWSIEKGVLSERNEPQKATDSNPLSVSKPKKRNSREEKKALQRSLRKNKKELEKVEIQIKTLQNTLQNLNHEITQASIDEAKEKTEQLSKTQVEMQTLEQKWIVISEKKEKIESELKQYN